MLHRPSSSGWLAPAAFTALLGLSSCAVHKRPVAGQSGGPATPSSAATPPSEATLGAGIAGPEASPITFERMAHWPEPGGQVPRSIAYSPDGKRVTYLQSEHQDDVTALFVF